MNAIEVASGHVICLHSVITGPSWDALIATLTATVLFMGKLVFSSGVGKTKLTIDAFGVLVWETIKIT